MRKTTLLAMIFAAILLTWAAACSQSDGTATDPKVSGQEVKQAAGEAVDTAVAYSQQKKDAYIKKIESELDELDRKVENLAAKAKNNAEEVKGESRETFDQAMTTLKVQKQAAMEKLAELKDAGADTWDTVKDGFDDALEELEQQYEKIKTNFES